MSSEISDVHLAELIEGVVVTFSSIILLLAEKDLINDRDISRLTDDLDADAAHYDPPDLTRVLVERCAKDVRQNVSRGIVAGCRDVGRLRRERLGDQA